MKTGNMLWERIKKFSHQDLFLVITIIGLLPAIYDFSLFALFGFSQSNFGDLDPEKVSFLQKLHFRSLWLFPLGLYLAVRYRRPDRFIGLLPYVFSFAVFIILQYDLLPENSGFLFTIFYFACYKLAFFYMVEEGNLRSLPMVVGLMVVWILLDVYHFFLFLTYTALVKLIYLAIVQNFAIFKNTRVKKNFSLFGKSVLYWSPLLLFIIPSAIFSNKIHKKAVDGIYANTFVETTDSINRFKRVQFEKDLKISVDKEVDSLKVSINAAMDSVKVESEEMSVALPNKAGKTFYKVVPDELGKVIPGLMKEECTFPNIFCYFENGVKGEMDKSYKKSRKRGHKNLVKEVRDLTQSKNDSIQALANNTKQLVETRLEDVKTGLRKTIQGVFDLNLFINLLLDILFGFVIVKSFMYVFSRVAFSQEASNYISLLENEEGMNSGTLKKFENQYTIPISSNQDFFVSRSYEPSGRAPKFSIPQWNKAFIGRIFTGNYAMNHIKMDQADTSVYFRAMGGKEFVEWELAEDEEVIFNFKNFVGMSANIKISAVISMRLTSLLLGRIIFTTAKGPGKLVLMTTGKPIISDERKAEASVAVSRILAWQRNTRFQVESEVNLVDVFMSGIYLKKQPSDLILIDADVKGKAKSGIVKFIKNFLMPI
ncbi:AIM24 family protein [Spongiivirga sp. MCCC 1A20706]|uniref:AIM24 family protein n=1 Tax=Spongiivirga sp. MCCC 1A20706 TaxID=3160963 RepID=UPI0039772711